MQLRDFYDYKNQLMKDLLTDETIVRLVDKDASVSTAVERLMYKRVFPYEYLPETTEFSSTYICCDVDILSSDNKTFLNPVLYIWVFTHKSLMRLPEGGVRVDELASKICERINGSRFYTLGELNFNSCKRFAPMTDYNGKCLVFHGKEFNRQYNPNNPTPLNRKAGR